MRKIKKHLQKENGLIFFYGMLMFVENSIKTTQLSTKNHYNYLVFCLFKNKWLKVCSHGSLLFEHLPAKYTRVITNACL